MKTKTTEEPRRLEYMKLSAVKVATVNPKDHDIGEICVSIQKRGFVELPAIDERTGKLVAGHGRFEALAALKKQGAKLPAGLRIEKGEWMVPVVRGWASKSDADAQAYLISSNRLTEIGGWNDETLAAELAKLANEGIEHLLGTGYDGNDVDKMLNERASLVTRPTCAASSATSTGGIESCHNF